MKPSQIAQALIGVILGLVIMGGAVGGVGYLYLNRFSQNPERPQFANKDANPEPKPAQPQPYPAVVIYSEGLILRKEQSTDSEVLKILEYEEPITVIEPSPDQKWQKVSTEDTESLEGWIAAGNTERVPADPSPESDPVAEESLPEEAFPE